MTSVDAYNRILASPGKFFFVEFHLRRASRTDGRPAGTIRRMLAKVPCHKYKKGIVSDAERAAEDAANDTVTCWDVQKFKELRANGVPLMEAGWQSYRRIPLDDIVNISIPPVIGP